VKALELLKHVRSISKKAVEYPNLWFVCSHNRNLKLKNTFCEELARL
jgi:hypothetical protein